MSGIFAYGAYVPYFRLKRSTISQALGAPSAGGTRAVASHDEDSTTMAVEAARLALGAAPKFEPNALYFATASPVYQDKANATAVHAALGLDERALAVDMAGAVSSGVGALRVGLDSPRRVLVVASDMRTGLPGSADERDGGDGAAAVLCGAGEGAIAQLVGQASTTREFLDRWRTPGELASRTWEERFAEGVYVSLGEAALHDALKEAGVEPGGVDHLVVTGTHARAARRLAQAAGARTVADDLSGTVGNTGTAHPLLVLASVLDVAEPGEVLALVVLADGAHAFVFRTTQALADRRAVAPVAQQVASGRDDLPYASFLTWRGLLRRDPPRRPDPQPPAAPAALRAVDWKFSLVGTRCVACGTRHFPPARRCLECGAIDQMQPQPVAGTGGTISTYTIDRLAYSLSPPVVVGVVDLDGGGRLQCELADADPERLAVGARVEMTFRRISTANGVHNYFWKARPVRLPAE